MERAVRILTLSVAVSQYNVYNWPQMTSGHNALFRANGPIIQGDCLQWVSDIFQFCYGLVGSFQQPMTPHHCRWVEADPGGLNEAFCHEKIGPIQRRTQSLRERLWKILNSSWPRYILVA
jgi:hypothetical protein